jgi:hypothetical protein
MTGFGRRFFVLLLSVGVEWYDPRMKDRVNEPFG